MLIFFCALSLSILHGPNQRGRSGHFLPHSCLLIVSPIMRMVCIHKSFAPYACIHLDRWVRGPFCSKTLFVNHIRGFPKYMLIILMHSHQSSILRWCVPHHLVSIACSTHFRASKHCCSGTSVSKFLRKSPPHLTHHTYTDILPLLLYNAMTLSSCYS